MISFSDFTRLATPIWAKIKNMIRASKVVGSSYNATMKIYYTDTEGVENRSYEHVHNYGYISRPLAGSECMSVNIGGDGAQAVAILTYDRRHQIQLEEGEVALYTHINSTTPHRILLKNNGELDIMAGKINFIGPAEIGPENSVKRRLVNQDFLTWASSHTHIYTLSGVPTPTSAPVVSPTDIYLTEDTKAS